MISTFIPLVIIGQLIFGTLIFAPISRKSDPAFYWIGMCAECLMFMILTRPYFLQWYLNAF